MATLATGCGDDGAPIDMGTSSTGEESSSSSSSTGDDTTGGSSSGGESSSSSTGPDVPPPVGWGDCRNLAADLACLPDETCFEAEAGSICMRTDCEASFDCPPELRLGGTAPVVCGEVAGGPEGLECHYLCTSMQECPEGMVCTGDACAWP